MNEDEIKDNDDTEPDLEDAPEPEEGGPNGLEAFKAELDADLAESEKSGPWRIFSRWLKHHVNPALRQLQRFIGSHADEFAKFVLKNWKIISKIIFLTAVKIKRDNNGKLKFDDMDDLAKDATLNFLNYAKENPDKIEAGAEWIALAIRLAIIVLQLAGRLA